MLADDLKSAYTKGAYADQGYSDFGYKDSGYVKEGYAKTGYTDKGYTHTGHTDEGYLDDGYMETGYFRSKDARPVSPLERTPQKDESKILTARLELSRFPGNSWDHSFCGKLIGSFSFSQDFMSSKSLFFESQ